ncbi:MULTISPECIES: ROK family transcriptional regulator [Mesorhizobium]|nr:MULTISPECIES: ROK family transcriptional regulator [Mesorhizobium]
MALHRGTNQSGMRDSNERVVLSLVRLHGGLAKSDIARMTGLSAQTVSVIMRALEADGLLVKGEPQRGRIGQPSVPMSLNPDGAFFLGLKVGRRSADLVMTDFLGNVRAQREQSYIYPTPDETKRFLLSALREIRASIAPAQQGLIAGLGIAMPFELWSWAEIAGAPRELMDRWRDRDIRAEIQNELPFPVFLQNDATSACGAELVFGRVNDLRDFVYFFIGAFAGGGVVLNGRLYSGPTGNAGALGSMPVPGPAGRPAQLIDIASLGVLEKRLKAAGSTVANRWTELRNWQDAGAVADQWITDAANALAYSVVSATSVIDFEAAIIEGWMPPEIRARLTNSVRAALARIDVEGLKVPEIREGSVGHHARAIGAASLPLSERFLVGSNALSFGAT